MKRHRGKKYGLLLVLLLSTSSAMATVSYDWAVIGNAGNVADDTGYGSVSYEYRISTTEVTTAQYVEFLNAVAATDTYGLYNSNMSNTYFYKGISQSGISGNYTYTANAGWANRPVTYVSWYDALRFVNWLNNGQLSGAQDATTTEDGAYTFSGATSVSTRNTGADYWLPSEDEWYKAAYYSPGGVYYDYATGSDDVPVAGDDANYNDSGYVEGSPYYSTEVGEYDNESPYGTYDQNGNVWEWNETLINGQYRGLRGGSWTSSANHLPSSYRNNINPTNESLSIGFRVASYISTSTVPEPMSARTYAVEYRWSSTTSGKKSLTLYPKFIDLSKTALLTRAVFFLHAILMSLFNS